MDFLDSSRGRWRRLASLLGGASIAATACNTNVSFVDGGGDDNGGDGGGFTFLNEGGDGLSTDPGTRPDREDPLQVFDDPGCGDDQPPAREDFSCDPYAQGNGNCAPDEACYIFVDYPEQPCGQEVYGSYCAPSGFGVQGDACGGPLDCATGHVCVITGAGTQCIRLCPLVGRDGCEDGLVCEPIDVEGFGGCL